MEKLKEAIDLAKQNKKKSVDQLDNDVIIKYEPYSGKKSKESVKILSYSKHSVEYYGEPEDFYYAAKNSYYDNSSNVFQFTFLPILTLNLLLFIRMSALRTPVRL